MRMGVVVAALVFAIFAGGGQSSARESGSLMASGILDDGNQRPVAALASSANAHADMSDVTKAPASDSANALPTSLLKAVAQHFSDSLTDELYDNFQLFLYVSKAEAGPWAQRMFVFQKRPDGSLVLAANWDVSTGRERDEFNNEGKELPSYTPAGFYELDPKRMFVDYTSRQWGEAMPYAMFFQWKKDGKTTGLAIHAASDDEIPQLGTRASAGCVRLAPHAAHDLFNLVHDSYGGPVPQFDSDPLTNTTNNDGILLHNPDGSLQLTDGYKVLVVVDNYGGDSAVASAQ